MGKVKKKRKNTFNYSLNRKKLKRRARKKDAPRIACDELRRAWDDSRSVASNLADMGLASDPNKALSLHADTDTSAGPKHVRKPYVLQDLKASASLPSKKTMGISSDMVFYVRHMVESHGEDYKAMARDDQNYYQDTPKQIQRKITLYRRHHPTEYQALIASRTKQ